jgi:hypothetical protein
VYYLRPLSFLDRIYTHFFTLVVLLVLGLAAAPPACSTALI